MLPVTLSGAPISISDGKTLIGTYGSVAVGVGVAVGVAEMVGVSVGEGLTVAVAVEVDVPVAVGGTVATPVWVASAVAPGVGLSVNASGLSMEREETGGVVVGDSACSAATVVDLLTAVGKATRFTSRSRSDISRNSEITMAKTTPAASGFPHTRLRPSARVFPKRRNLLFIVRAQTSKRWRISQLPPSSILYRDRHATGFRIVTRGIHHHDLNYIGAVRHGTAVQIAKKPTDHRAFSAVKIVEILIGSSGRVLQLVEIKLIVLGRTHNRYNSAYDRPVSRR